MNIGDRVKFTECCGGVDFQASAGQEFTVTTKNANWLGDQISAGYAYIDTGKGEPRDSFRGDQKPNEDTLVLPDSTKIGRKGGRIVLGGK